MYTQLFGNVSTTKGSSSKFRVNIAKGTTGSSKQCTGTPWCTLCYLSEGQSTMRNGNPGRERAELTMCMALGAAVLVWCTTVCSMFNGLWDHTKHGKTTLLCRWTEVLTGPFPLYHLTSCLPVWHQREMWQVKLRERKHLSNLSKETSVRVVLLLL
jgi:hypothetical protein